MAKGQASAELLTVISIMAALMLPLLLLSYINASSSAQKTSLAVATAAASQIASTSDSVGYLGEGSSMLAEIEMPPNVQAIEIRNSQRVSEIVLNISTSSGYTQLVFLSRFQISANGADLKRLATVGLHRVKISAQGNSDGLGMGTVQLEVL